MPNDMTSSDYIAIAALAVSIVSLIVGLVFSLITSRYSKQQIANANEQLEELRKQFNLSRNPDVELKLYVQRTHPDTKNFATALFNEATNHDPNIAVSDLSCMAVVELPPPHDSASIIGFIGVTLTPGQSIKQKTSIENTDEFRARYFPEYKDWGFVVTEPDRPWTKAAERHPLTVYWSYKPRIAGAEEIKIEKKMFLEVFPAETKSG
jgi:hypothetical protein